MEQGHGRELGNSKNLHSRKCEIYAWPKISKSLQSVSQFELAGGKVSDSNNESCGLAVEHSAHDRKVVGSIPVQSNARWKWC